MHVSIHKLRQSQCVALTKHSKFSRPLQIWGGYSLHILFFRFLVALKCTPDTSDTEAICPQRDYPISNQSGFKEKIAAAIVNTC